MSRLAQLKHRVLKNSQVRIGLSVVAAVMVIAAHVSSAHAQENPTPKVDLAKGKAVAEQFCAACHNADGNSVISANPKLAQQHSAYIEKQLLNFKVAPGAADAERANAVMAGFAAMLSDQDIKNVASWFESNKLNLGQAPSSSLLTLGQKIYRGGIAEKNVPACAGCHGPSGAGLPAQYPRLHGQHTEYTATQLTQFRQGERKNSAQMTAIAARLSDMEIKALSDYIAGMR